MRDDVEIKGRVKVVKRDKDTGEVKEEREKENLVVDDGKALIAERIPGNSPAPSHMALGDSNTSPTAGDSALQGSEFARVTFSNTSTSANDLTYTAQFTGTWTGTVEEAGIFNDASAGTMLARFLTGTFDKDSNDEIEVQWTLTVG